MSINKTDSLRARGDELSLRWIEAFRATMRSGSVSGAARLMSISQPAVTLYIKQLEAVADIDLFDRRRGRLIPTDEARLLLLEVERVYRGLEQVRQHMQALKSHAAAAVRLGCLHALASGVVPRAVARLRARYPGVRVSLRVESSAVLRNLVADGVVDLAIMADEVRLAGLSGSVFYEVPAVCLLPRRHRLARLDAITPENLDRQPLIALAQGDQTRERIERVLEAHGCRPEVVVETPYGATHCALVQAGVGLALVNPLTSHHLSLAGVVAKPFQPRIPFRAVLAFAPGTALGRMQQAFVEECRKEVGRSMA